MYPLKADAVGQQIAESHSWTTGKGAVLIVEDEQAIGLSLRFVLSNFRLVIIQTKRSEEAVSALRNAHFDATLLDLNRPGTSGMEVCRGIRKDLPRLPILMLAVKNNEDQELEAFEAGVDDYIAKPFHYPNLVARLDATIRRGRLCNGYDEVISVGDVSLDSSRHLAKKNGRPIHLTPTQFKLLHLLMANSGETLPHKRLLMNVWGPVYGSESDYLRPYIRQLRLKIEDDPAKPKYLLTEPCFGYRFNEPA